MSKVTNTILAFSITEDVQERFDEVNQFFPGRSGFRWTWDDTNSWVGGTKSLEHPTFIAAFNYLDDSALVKHIRGIKWKEPENVQLILCRDEDDHYAIITIFGLGLGAYSTQAGEFPH